MLIAYSHRTARNSLSWEQMAALLVMNFADLYAGYCKKIQTSGPKIPTKSGA